VELFISHSWKNKTVADKLASDLEGTAKIWIDHQQTKPGEFIGEDVGEGLKRSDIVVVLWSKHAKKSDWVKGEVDWALQNGRTVIPCLLDDKKLPKRWRHLLGVPFADYTQGFARLSLVLFKHGARELGIADEKLLEQLDDWDGVVNYLNDYRQQNEVSGDAAYWIDRVLQVTTEAKAGGSVFLEQYQDVVEFTQTLTERVEAAKDDRAALQEILHDVIRHEHLAPPILQKMRVLIEQMIDTLAEEGVPPVASTSEEQVLASISSIRGHEQPPEDSHDPKVQLRNQLRDHVDSSQLEEIVDLLFDYIEASNPVLTVLVGVAQARQSMAGVTVVQYLAQYLQEPNDLLPESQFGYFGYLDDGWLIHNTAWRLIESGIVQQNLFAVDWQRIQIADGLVRRILPPVIMTQLENLLMQYIGLIAAEIQGYQPQFVTAGNRYHPDMGAGSAADRWYDVAVDSLNYL
jgi:uncharacterized membrane protein YkvA (DUF1232 family)